VNLSLSNHAPFLTGELDVIRSYRKRQGAGAVTHITVVRVEEHAAKARRKEIRVPRGWISPVSSLSCHQASGDRRSPVVWRRWPLGDGLFVLAVIVGDLHGLAWSHEIGLTEADTVPVG
jgi:hypothetical protein